MAPNRNLDSRWVRRYRSFFIVGSVILGIQVFLAYRFFPIDAEEDESSQEHRDLSGKGLNVEVSRLRQLCMHKTGAYWLGGRYFWRISCCWMNRVSQKIKLKFHYTPWRHIGRMEVDTAALILNVGWRWLISFRPRPLYLRIGTRRYPFHRRPVGPQSLSGRFGGEKFSSAGIRTSGRNVRNLIMILTKLPRLYQGWRLL
jgi:hypothetical protein